MRKDRVPAQNVRDDRVGGPRKLRCTHCRSEFALPIRNGKKLVYHCPKCQTEFVFQSV
jgi:Zn finger protein HypA/HybF involved in hydrogenase expression